VCVADAIPILNTVVSLSAPAGGGGGGVIEWVHWGGGSSTTVPLTGGPWYAETNVGGYASLLLASIQ
jgi:hypothetical protein